MNDSLTWLVNGVFYMIPWVVLVLVLNWCCNRHTFRELELLEMLEAASSDI